MEPQVEAQQRLWVSDSVLQPVPQKGLNPTRRRRLHFQAFRVWIQASGLVFRRLSLTKPKLSALTLSTYPSLVLHPGLSSQKSCKRLGSQRLSPDFSQTWLLQAATEAVLCISILYYSNILTMHYKLFSYMLFYILCLLVVALLVAVQWISESCLSPLVVVVIVAMVSNNSNNDRPPLKK